MAHVPYFKATSWSLIGACVTLLFCKVYVFGAWYYQVEETNLNGPLAYALF